MTAKTGEFAQGVGSLEFEDFPTQLQVYGRLIEPDFSQERYPCSPLISVYLLPPPDDLPLFDLQPKEPPSLPVLLTLASSISITRYNCLMRLPPLFPVSLPPLYLLYQPSSVLASFYS